MTAILFYVKFENDKFDPPCIILSNYITNNLILYNVVELKKFSYNKCQLSITYRHTLQMNTFLHLSVDKNN